MKILIIGASGMAGQAIYNEAKQRGHQPTGLVRNKAKALEVLGSDANIIQQDAFTLTKDELTRYDVVIKSFSTPPNLAYRHVDLAAHLVAELRETESPRAVFILGAASLLDAEDKPFMETLKTIPDAASWIGIPIGQYKELQFLREVDNVNWVGISPSVDFIPGPKHTPKVGRDHVLFAGDGKSHVTNATLASALLDELEKPSVIKGRFTVSDS